MAKDVLTSVCRQWDKRSICSRAFFLSSGCDVDAGSEGVNCTFSIQSDSESQMVM